MVGYEFVRKLAAVVAWSKGAMFPSVATGGASGSSAEDFCLLPTIDLMTWPRSRPEYVCRSTLGFGIC